MSDQSNYERAKALADKNKKREIERRRRNEKEMEKLKRLLEEQPTTDSKSERGTP